jgi:pimeloyl-ACP methyl ester carboxylesterase
MTAATAAALLTLAAAAGADAPRYDLRVGDHLVFAQRLTRIVQSPDQERETRGEWECHLLVVAEKAGRWQVGIQRNRRSVELVREREGGHDRTERERPAFMEAMAARPIGLAEANWIEPDGAAILPWSAVREAASEWLPFVHELMPLPRSTVGVGERFVGPAPLGLSSRFGGTETIGGEECLRLEGEAPGGVLRLRQWHGVASGLPVRVEYAGRSSLPPNRDVREALTIERMRLARGEGVSMWLADEATVQGALAGVDLTEPPPLSAAALGRLLDGTSDPEVERLALGVAHRHHVAVSVPTLERLLGSADARVRALALRRLEDAPAASAAPLLARGSADAEWSVRDAAAATEKTREALALVPLARSVLEGGPLPEWRCGEDEGRARRALWARRFSGQVPGATLRLMADPRFRGRPYVLMVPDDYRGDAPFPLLVFLGGGPGRAIPTAQSTAAALTAGWLVAWPQAGGMWWEPEPAAAVEALLGELLATLNVDTNRVFLAGFSNGGTGTLLYASRWGHRLAAAAPLMGAGLQFFQGSESLPRASLARLPLLFVHGDRDEVIPAWASERTVKDLRKENPEASVEMHVLKGRGHDIIPGRDDGLLVPFLARQRREPFPRSVTLRARDLAHARSFWVEVTDKEGGTAEVDGTIDDQQVRLTTRHVKVLRLLLRRELLPGEGPVRVVIDRREVFSGPLVEDCALLAKSWAVTADPFLAHSVELAFDVK